MNGLKPLLNKLFGNKTTESRRKSGSEKATPFHLFILVLVIGISFMLISNMVTSKDKGQSVPTNSTVFSENQQKDIEAFKTKSDQTPDSMKSYEKDYEDRLENLLNKVEGISNVQVMVNLATSEQSILDKDSSTKSNQIDETDSNNGHRETVENNKDEKTVIIGSGDNQKPVTIGKEKPQVEGVLIVAQGVQNVQVKSIIIKAVSSVLGVPEYKVNVLIGKPKED